MVNALVAQRSTSNGEPIRVGMTGRIGSSRVLRNDGMRRLLMLGTPTFPLAVISEGPGGPHRAS